MPETMQLDGFGLDTLRGTIQRPRKGHRIEDLPNVIGKHEVLIFVRSAEHQPMLDLVDLVFMQSFHRAAI